MTLHPRFETALKAYNKFKNHKRVKNHDYIFVVDYTLPSNQKRLFLFDLKTLTQTHEFYVAHGRGSNTDPSKNAKAKDRIYAVRFSNVPQSFQSSLGAIATGDIYDSPRFKEALRLHGLEPGLNDNIYRRAIVLHKSYYVSDDYIQANGRAGNSLGCLAIDQKYNTFLLNKLEGGVFGYLYYGKS